MESPPCHRHDGTSPLPLGMDACPPPARWTGKDTVWPHDPRSGWSYCAVVATWTILSATRTLTPADVNGTVFYRVQVAIQSPTAVSYMRGLLRRFSDFLKLHAALRKAFPKKRIPPPPPKNPLQRMNSNPALLEERRRALDDWMQQVLMDIDYSRSVPMAGFLELEAAARGAASALSQDDSPSSSLPSNLPTAHDTATVSTAPHRSPSSTPRTVSSDGQSPASNMTSVHQRSHADLSSHLADSGVPSRPPSRSASASEAAPVVGPAARAVWTAANEQIGTAADATRAISQLEEANLGSGGRGGIASVSSEREVTDGEVAALLEAEFGIQKGVAEGGGNLRIGGRDAEGVAKESAPEGELVGILKNGWHRRTGSGGSENSDASSFSGIGSEPSEISTSASLFGGDMSTLLAERERQQEAEAAGAIDGAGSQFADNKAMGGMGGGKAGASSGDVLRNVGMILPSDHRMIVQRMLTVMQRRLTTAKADVDELLARLKQETAIKEFLTSKVRDLEGELDETRSKSREALLQVHMAEREKLTELQWTLEEARFELHKEKEERRRDKEQIEASEKRAQDAESAQEEVMQELEVLGAQLEAAKHEREEIDAKAKMEKRVLIKEVKSLRHAQVVLKDEAEAAMFAREEAEKKLRDLEEQMAEDALQRAKLVHEVGVLRERLKDCGELVKLDGEGAVLDPSSDLVDVLSVSNQRIECILAETQLLREHQMNGTTSQADACAESSGRPAGDNDEHADIAGQGMDNGQPGKTTARTRRERVGSKAGLPEASLRAVFADILSDNAHLRKVVNSLMRGAALSAQKT
ncbi:hypothetical protein CBR_g22383 [Chara braunii]|uniref:PX domain-containing protein n=1 Tax=Chara braunii TaxID=69332 RepID=A0A388JUV2_CHABU|nr:hypothetical protein CBR_g22383 [Chara braunii]|eukprot:GBG61586.1 hypothetical protein CBR_g22383 [Chara braunii]